MIENKESMDWRKVFKKSELTNQQLRSSDDTTMSVEEYVTAYRIFPNFIDKYFSERMKNDYSKIMYVRLKTLLGWHDKEEIQEIFPSVDFNHGGSSRLKQGFKNSDGYQPFSTNLKRVILKNFKQYSFSEVDFLTAKELQAGTHFFKYLPSNLENTLELLEFLKDTDFLKTRTKEEWLKGSIAENLPYATSVKKALIVLSNLYPMLTEDILSISKDFSDNVIEKTKITDDKSLKLVLSFTKDFGSPEGCKKVVEALLNNSYLGGYKDYKPSIDRITKDYPDLDVYFKKIKEGYQNLEEDLIFEEGEGFLIRVYLPSVEKKWEKKRLKSHQVVEQLTGFLNNAKTMLSPNTENKNMDNLFALIRTTSLEKEDNVYQVLNFHGVLPQDYPLEKKEVIENLKTWISYYIDQNNLKNKPFVIPYYGLLTEGLIMKNRIEKDVSSANCEKNKKIKF